MNTKSVLDVCCGSKMFWFDKNNSNTLFLDNRTVEDVLCDGRNFKVSPDEIMDFRQLDIPDNTFPLVVFDPPHFIKLGEKSWLCKKYGKLSPDWQTDLRRGFAECFRVLKDSGVLIFKWNERDIKLKSVLELTDYKPLFGNRGKSSATFWIVFQKNKHLRKGAYEPSI